MDQFEIRAREPLFFMHIPKTAGMSMRLYLREQYQLHDICPFARWHGILGREHELSSFRLVQGHFRYNLREVLAKGARVLVMLRDPLRRTVSALRHLQRDPSFHLDHELAKGLTLPEMIRHPGLMENQRNVQARFLCASLPSDAVSAYLQRELPRNPNADAGDIEDPPTLQLARDRLETIDFVGLTEDIHAVVSTMAAAMNYHPPLYFPFINEDPVRTNPLQELTEEDLAILHNYNDIDIHIYEDAKRLIERRAFDRDMRQLVRSGIYTVPSGSFEIPLSGIMPGSGWYTPDQGNGTFWRWTGPGRYFTIEVPLREDISYRLIIRFGSLRPLGSADLGAEINDTPVAFELSSKGDAYRCELVIPQALLAQSSGFCRIRFDTKETTRLAPPDIRALGISVWQIVFECMEVPKAAISRPNALAVDGSPQEMPASLAPPPDDIFPDKAEMAAELDRLMKVSRDLNPLAKNWSAGEYCWSDAIAYYAMIRSRKPRTIVELGGGRHTAIAQMACARNGMGRIMCVDPNPDKFLKSVPGIELIRRRTQDLEAGFLNTLLEDEDLLFLASRHHVDGPGDRRHIYRQILPAIKAEVTVHVPDIYLPDTPPISSLREDALLESELDQLYAYMRSNPRTRAIYGSRYHLKYHPEMMTEFLHRHWDEGGTSFWLDQDRGTSPKEKSRSDTRQNAS